MKTTKVYISGAISKHCDGNKQAFQSASEKILGEGKYPVNPHDVCYFLVPGSPWVAYMKKNIPALVASDEIYMLRGWLWSRGALLEWFLAKVLKITVRYEGREICRA